MKISSDGEIVRIETQKDRHSTESEYSLIVKSKAHGHQCNIVLSKDDLPMMAGSYEVTVTPLFFRTSVTSALVTPASVR
jgi:hypothetical protein